MEWHGERVLVTPNGQVKPLTDEERWRNVHGWYEYLEAERSSERPTVDSFNEAWELLDNLYEFQGEPVHKRGAESQCAATPLATLFYCIEMGFYPPPELMLALLDDWHAYRSSNGVMSLEQAFLGRTVQKAGNAAKRFNSTQLKLRMRFEFARLLREGKSRQEAAEAVSQILPGSPEPESILRELRGFTDFSRRTGK